MIRKECGEAKLIAAVEAGRSPSTVTLEIAIGSSESVQRTMIDGYESGSIKGTQMRAVRRRTRTVDLLNALCQGSLRETDTCDLGSSNLKEPFVRPPKSTPVTFFRCGRLDYL